MTKTAFENSVNVLNSTQRRSVGTRWEILCQENLSIYDVLLLCQQQQQFVDGEDWGGGAENIFHVGGIDDGELRGTKAWTYKTFTGGGRSPISWGN